MGDSVALMAERRGELRMRFTGGLLPPTARMRPGLAVVVVDAAPGGVRFEAPWRFRPGGRTELVIVVGGVEHRLPVRVLRCEVSALPRQGTVRYRTAVALEPGCELPPWRDPVHGYQIPRSIEPRCPGRVGPSHGASPSSRETATPAHSRPKSSREDWHAS